MIGWNTPLSAMMTGVLRNRQLWYTRKGHCLQIKIIQWTTAWKRQKIGGNTWMQSNTKIREEKSEIS